MPELEKLTNKYDEFQDVLIYAVVVPTSIIDTSWINVVPKLCKKYEIHYAISLDNIQTVTSNFNFNTFPHVIIIDKTGTVIYNGRFNNNPLIFVNNISTLLNDYISDIDKKPN
jgi:hypothetical protein